MSYKDYITTFTKTAISKTGAKHSDNSGKNSKGIVDPRMLENVRDLLKMELDKFANCNNNSREVAAYILPQLK